MKRKIVVATANPGKLKDFKHILGEADYEFLTLTDIGFDDEIIEDGDSFDANALIKVRDVHKFCGHAVLADDSGICVEALNGAPGIYSARYAGQHGQDISNNELLLKNMQGIENRKTWYHCSLAFKEEDGKESLFSGQIFGQLLEEPQGDGGFGYDPLFIPDGFKTSFAQMDISEKKAISHRGQAIAKLFEYLNK